MASRSRASARLIADRLAGTSHASFYAVNYVDAQLLRDQSVPGPSGPLSFTKLMEQQGCTLRPLFSKVDTGLVLSAALDSVRRWAETGRAAAPSRQFQRDDQGSVLRDAQGRVLGGVRLPQFDVPTSATARNGDALGCLLAGHHRDFTADEFKQRYGSQRAYARAVGRVMQAAMQAGYVLPSDAQAAIRAAGQAAQRP